MTAVTDAPPAVDDMSPAEASTELEKTRGEITADHPLINANSPGHRAAVERNSALHTRALDTPESGAAPAPSAAHGMTPAAAQAELDRRYAEIGANPRDAYVDPNHPGHAAAVRAMGELHAAAAAEDAGNAEAEKTTADESARENLADPTSFDEPLRDVILPSDAPIVEIAEGLDTARGWFAEAGFTELEARTVIRAFNDPGDAGDATLDDDAAEAQGRTAMAAHFGAAAEDKIAAARRAVVRLNRDGKLVNFLNNTVAGNDPRVIGTLADVAVRNGW